MPDALRVPLRPETILDKTSFTMIRSEQPFDNKNSRTCLFVRARQDNRTLGVDVWGVVDPPNFSWNLKATLHNVPFQDQLYLYPLGALNNNFYIDLPVVMMGNSSRSVAAILWQPGYAKVEQIASLGSTALHPGIGRYGIDRQFPSLGFYVSDSTTVYFIRAGLGELTEFGRSKLPVQGTIYSHPTDNLNQYDYGKGTSKTAAFLSQPLGLLWFVCDPETTGSTKILQDKTPHDSRPQSPPTLLRLGQRADDAYLVMNYVYQEESNIPNITMDGLTLPSLTGVVAQATIQVDPVGFGRYIYYVTSGLQSIQLVTVDGQKIVTSWSYSMPGTVVGQPCLGPTGDLIVTYDGSKQGNSSGCLALGTNGAVNWTYEPPGCRPLAAAVCSLDWVGFFGATADNKPFVDLLVKIP